MITHAYRRIQVELKWPKNLKYHDSMILLAPSPLLRRAVSAHAAGTNGWAIGGSVGATGGTTASIASGLEVGANFENGKWFVGAFYDRFTPSIWQAGFGARQFFGPSRLFWFHIKVSLSGMAGMIGDQAVVKEWNNYINGGLAAGMRR